MKAYFKVILREMNEEGRLVLYNDGYIKVEDNNLEGYLTFDYIQGMYKDGILHLGYFEMGSENAIYFEAELDYLELPEKYFFDIEATIFEFDFFEKVTDINVQQRIDKNIQEVKEVFFNS